MRQHLNFPTIPSMKVLDSMCSIVMYNIVTYRQEATDTSNAIAVSET